MCVCVCVRAGGDGIGHAGPLSSQPFTCISTLHLPTSLTRSALHPSSIGHAHTSLPPPSDAQGDAHMRPEHNTALLASMGYRYQVGYQFFVGAHEDVYWYRKPLNVYTLFPIQPFSRQPTDEHFPGVKIQACSLKKPYSFGGILIGASRQCFFFYGSIFYMRLYMSVSSSIYESIVYIRRALRRT